MPSATNYSIYAEFAPGDSFCRNITSSCSYLHSPTAVPYEVEKDGNFEKVTVALTLTIMSFAGIVDVDQTFSVQSLLVYSWKIPAKCATWIEDDVPLVPPLCVIQGSNIWQPKIDHINKAGKLEINSE